jgi:hypothetical protein
LVLHTGLAHRPALLDITGPWAKVEPTAWTWAALAQNVHNASSRACAMHSFLDFALVVADVVILLERSTHYPLSFKKAGARLKASLLELHGSDAWFRANK